MVVAPDPARGCPWGPPAAAAGTLAHEACSALGGRGSQRAGWPPLQQQLIARGAARAA